MINKLTNKKQNKTKEERIELAISHKNQIKSNLNNLSKLTDRQWGRYLLDQDPVRGKIDSTKYDEYVLKAIEAGESAAINLKEKYPNLDTLDLLSKLNIEYTVEKREGAFDYVIFGMYQEPKSLTIYQDNIKDIQEIIDTLNLDTTYGDIEKTVIYHELYHYIEEIKPEIYTRSTRIDLWSIGSMYTRTSGLRSLSEIGAMAFSKKMLDLNYNPTILDYLFLVGFEISRSQKLYEFIINYKKL